MLVLFVLLVACWLVSGTSNTDRQANSTNLVSGPGQRAIVPKWRMQSTKHITGNASSWSRSGLDVSTWYEVSSRGTVMSGLLENRVYDDTNLFYSDNLRIRANQSEFTAPWLYREEFALNLTSGQHYFVQTHGITSRANIYLNEALIVSKDHQIGAYGGQKYDVTSRVRGGSNVLVIEAYPTNYLYDFALGFIDWNPYPQDNGTGVWRHVEVLQTGPVSISPLRIVTDYKGLKVDNVRATIKADLYNHGTIRVEAGVHGVIQHEDNWQKQTFQQTTILQPKESRTISISVPIANPKIWWPRMWGEQPLYRISANVKVSGAVSDVTQQQSFGIRHVTSQVNSHNDTAFTVNGNPFLVIGAGYSPDMFLRFDLDRVKQKLLNVLDLGFNTIRLEGKLEQPELYNLADQMGLMVIAGWECCDKWEGWTYNEDVKTGTWTAPDYEIAKAQMSHEAMMLQTHPSMLAFLVGSDWWPDDKATEIYVNTLKRFDWPNPIIASAAKRGYPALLGPSGMKMDGPYDWVPPNYWYNDQLGAAFGFGSELGCGVGTPEMESLKKFLSPADMDDLWQQPEKQLFHLSKIPSTFTNRSTYNKGLYARFGKPISLEDYLLKAQVMDYEATRAQYEGYAAKKSSERPATGLIYWMLNSAWPSLHWQLFDYYNKGAGAYYGAKLGTRQEHVAYDYNRTSVHLISHSLTSSGSRKVSADLIDTTGKSLAHKELVTAAKPNQASEIFNVPGIDKLISPAFLKLILQDESGLVLSRNVYWLPAKNDVLDWNRSYWYLTPVTTYANMTALFKMKRASVSLSSTQLQDRHGLKQTQVVLENKSDVPAFFLRLNMLGDSDSQEITPVYWSDNYVTLWPKETLKISVGYQHYGKMFVKLTGANLNEVTTTVS